MEYLVLSNITKQYRDTGILANDHLSLSVKKGEVHAIVGDNGAGKSTLGKILYGILKRDKGDIFLNGEKINLRNEKDALSYKIAFVPQENFLIENFSVWENVVLGRERSILGFIQKNTLKNEVLSFMRTYSISLPLDKRVSELSIGEKKLLALLKALYKKPDILILDEPTSYLPDFQVKTLLSTILSLKEKGLTILFISHRWKEVGKVADRITILKEGKVVGTFSQDEFRESLNRLIGDERAFSFVKEQRIGEVFFEISHIVYKKNKNIILDDVSLELRRGEILSILSISGNGEKELEYIVSGFLLPTSGNIKIKGKEFTHITPSILRNYNISIIPTDTEYGISIYALLWENMIVSKYKSPPFSYKGFLNFKHIRSYTDSRLKEYGLPYSPNVKARSLSGGRMRRLILSRELLDNLDLIIAGNPTSSLDSGFTKKTLKKLVELSRYNNIGILLFLYNIDNALAISDRILILYKGRIVKDLKRGEFQRQKIMRYLVGEIDG